MHSRAYKPFITGLRSFKAAHLAVWVVFGSWIKVISSVINHRHANAEPAWLDQSKQSLNEIVSQLPAGWSSLAVKKGLRRWSWKKRTARDKCSKWCSSFSGEPSWTRCFETRYRWWVFLKEDILDALRWEWIDKSSTSRGVRARFEWRCQQGLF